MAIDFVLLEKVDCRIGLGYGVYQRAKAFKGFVSFDVRELAILCGATKWSREAGLRIEIRFQVRSEDNNFNSIFLKLINSMTQRINVRLTWISGEAVDNNELNRPTLNQCSVNVILLILLTLAKAGRISVADGDEAGEITSPDGKNRVVN